MSDDNRPIEVGDYVRWDGHMTDSRGNVTGKTERWAEGEVVSLDSGYVSIRIDRSCDGRFAPVAHFRGPIRRIPRPAEAQATEPPPAPVLVDGLSPNDCYQRWTANRAAIELGEPLRYSTLTADQIAAGRAAWRSGNEPKRLSAALLAKVTASDEAERNRVTYSEVEPWE